jgi:hypothetical protein
MRNTNATIKGEHNIPAGTHAGMWAGWQVEVNGVSYEMTQGIRGTAPAIVTVDQRGAAIVELS